VVTLLRRFAAGCLAVVILPVAVSDAGAVTAQEAIRSAYAALQAALLKNDPSAIASLLATKFQSRQVDGSIQDRGAYIKNQIEPTPGLTILSETIAITKLDIAGETAQAEAEYEVTGTYAVAGVAKPLRAIIRTTDRWALEGTWKLLSSTVHGVVSYVDGKLVRDEHEELPPSSSSIAELRTRAVVIPTLDLSANPQQLSEIGAAIGDARIVGMGEGSHGSREFFAFKDRLYKYLVENKGFTVFAMEAIWGGGLAVDRYIKGGQGTAQEAVAALGFWTWNTPEVVDLVQWMRDYNDRPGRHAILSFAGFDMQDPIGAMGYLVEFLRTHDPEMAGNAQAALSCVGNIVSEEHLGLHGKTPVADCRQGLSALGDRLGELGGAPGAEVARDALTNVLQYLDSQAAPSMLSLRDRDMAENVEWLATAEYPQAKIALWAHNGHISAGSSGDQSMGVYLRARFGSDYYAIGQTFGEGTVRAIVQARLQSVTIAPKPGGSIDALFGPLHATVFLDLRSLQIGSALGQYFSKNHGIEQIGAVADPKGDTDVRVEMIVPNAYDGLVYVPTSTASTYGIRPSQMQRAVTQNGLHWEVEGPGFDDVAVSAIADGAALTNEDGLNATTNALLRRFDATPYLGQTVRVTGEARGNNLLGFAYPLVRGVSANGYVMSSGPAITAQTSNHWIPFALKLSVPRNAEYIEAGIASAGIGSAEVRNITIGR
jgi:erythromycin esterase